MKPTYDITKSYDWNYENGPIFTGKIPERKNPHRGAGHSAKKFKLWDFELNSPIGVPAGPLLNSNWIKLYAELGFDIPVYKTVRSVYRECHPNPNCIYIQRRDQLTEDEIGADIVGNFNEPKNSREITITNSFGVPSKSPQEWMADIEKANSYMGEGQVMIVSINGTPGSGTDIVSDYVRVAEMAKEAGAKIIEANYSCPNVSTGEGSIYSDPEMSAKISQAIKKAIGNVPFMIKLGNFKNPAKLEEVAKANAPFVDGIAGINTIKMNVYNEAGEQALPGEGRLGSGLCGNAIHDIAQKFTENLAKIKRDNNFDFIICGVGGIMTADDFAERLEGGADIAMSATAAMWNPLLASEFHEKFGDKFN